LDHIKISHGGYNNNPTIRQFRSAYRKLVIWAKDVQNINTGNCIPLEDIDILHYSSADAVNVLKNSSHGCVSDAVNQENLIDMNDFIMDHDYIGCNSNYSFSNFTKEFIIYISGFVVHKLTKILKCDICKDALCSVERECFLNSLITLKNTGGNKRWLNISI